MSPVLKPEWVNTAEKWLKPLLSARAEEHGRAYGIGGHQTPAETIRQACVWSLHLHRTTWENQLDYIATYDALVREIKARRARSRADRARTAKARLPIPGAAPMIPSRILPAEPFAQEPEIRSNPEDGPTPRLRGFLFSDPAESSPRIPPPRRPETPVESAIRETDRGVRQGAIGHYQAGRWWSSRSAFDRAQASGAPLPRTRVQRGIRRAATRVITGRADFTVTMGQLARLAADVNGKRL